MKYRDEYAKTAPEGIGVDYLNDEAPTAEEVHRRYYLDKKNIDALRKAIRCDSLARV
jgi:hypothetical protein